MSPVYLINQVPPSLSVKNASDVIIGAYILGLYPKATLLQDIDRIGPTALLDTTTLDARLVKIVIMAFPFSEAGCRALNAKDFDYILDLTKR
jgi:hypothetical protein